MNLFSLFNRTLCCTLLCIFISLPLFSQKKQEVTPPDEVTQTFEFEQPNAKGLVWSYENGIYEAAFKSDGARTVTTIKSDGTLIKTIYEIPRSSLPSSITDFIIKTYPTSKISVTELWEEPNIRTYYYIEVKPEDITQKSSILTFNDVGKLLSRKDPEGYVAAASPNVPAQPADKEEQPKASSKPVAEKQPATPKAPKPTKNTPPPSKNSVDANTVPEIVKKALVKKGIRPTSGQWFKEDDHYRLDMIYREQPSQFFVSTTGVWQKSLIGMDKKMVVGNTLLHIQKYYKGAKIQKGIKEFRADKNDMIWIYITKKEDAKNKIITKLQFNKQGRFIKEVPKDGSEISQEYIPEAVKQAFAKKYPKVQGVEFQEDDEGYFLGVFFGMKGREFLVMEGNGMIIETRVEGNLANVNPNIKGFIKKKIKGGDITGYYVVRSVVEKRNYFLVIVTENKTGIVHKLKFSTNGKILQ